LAIPAIGEIPWDIQTLTLQFTSGVLSGGQVRNRATVIQQKTGRPVQFEIMTEARRSVEVWLQRRDGKILDFVFPSRVDYMGHLSTRQCANEVRRCLSGFANRAVIPCLGFGSRELPYIQTDAGKWATVRLSADGYRSGDCDHLGSAR
jgi:hypothetical protein